MENNSTKKFKNGVFRVFVMERWSVQDKHFKLPAVRNVWIKFCSIPDMEIQSPRFTGSSWLAFPALRGAYKHVQLSLELRPEAYDGIFFLTGERDDMAGDFMALLLHQGFVEFR